MDVLSDELVCVFLSALGDMVTLPPDHLKPAQPKVKEKVKVLKGEFKGKTGVLLGQQSNKGIVKLTGGTSSSGSSNNNNSGSSSDSTQQQQQQQQQLKDVKMLDLAWLARCADKRRRRRQREGRRGEERRRSRRRRRRRREAEEIVKQNVHVPILLFLILLFSFSQHAQQRRGSRTG